MGLTFTPVIDALANTVYVSNAAVASGLTLGTKNIQVIGDGELSIDLAPWGTNGVVQNGTSVRLRTTTPVGELGQVTTVTVDLQSVGYIDWTLTNRNMLMAEVGTGADVSLGFVVSPGAPMAEAATAFDTTFYATYPLLTEVGTGVDTPSYTLTTASMISETGTGSGAGFPSPGVLVVEEGAGTDDLYALLALVLDEVGTGVALAIDTLSGSALVSERGTGADIVLSMASTALVVETGTGTGAVYDGTAVSLLVAESSAVCSDTLLGYLAALGMLVEGGTAGDTLLPVNNVTINYDNVGYGFDEILIPYSTHGAWAFNARTSAISRWEELQITEVHEANGVVFGLAPDGVYRMSATQGANAVLESGLYDFNSLMQKHLRHVYVTYVSTTPLHIGAVRSNGGGKQRVLYGKPAYFAENPRQSRINIGRGPTARWWGCTVQNTDGGLASVKDLHLLVNETDRRV